jgi:undecaprenyl-diphosphatase
VFDIAIQTGAILAVIIGVLAEDPRTLVALPTAAAGAALCAECADRFCARRHAGPAVRQGHQGAPVHARVVVATAFIVGGFIILWAESASKHGGAHPEVDDMSGRWTP